MTAAHGISRLLSVSSRTPAFHITSWAHSVRCNAAGTECAHEAHLPAALFNEVSHLCMNDASHSTWSWLCQPVSDWFPAGSKKSRRQQQRGASSPSAAGSSRAGPAGSTRAQTDLFAAEEASAESSSSDSKVSLPHQLFEYFAHATPPPLQGPPSSSPYCHFPYQVASTRVDPAGSTRA